MQTILKLKKQWRGKYYPEVSSGFYI